MLHVHEERGAKMGINQDALMIVRAQMIDRIDVLARAAGRVRSEQLMTQIDDIRSHARDCGMTVLAGLADQLQRGMGGARGSVTISAYVDAMRDAVRCDNADATMMASLHASVGQRLYG
jgi:hypothetical protein